MYNIDLHVLVLGDENRLWYDHCLSTLNKQPVNIHICPGIRGNIAKARSLAIKQGTAEYVSWVDPDDFALPGAFEKMHYYANKGFPFVWMKELQIFYDDKMQEKYRSIRKTPHHIHIINRKIIDYDIVNYQNSNIATFLEKWIYNFIPQGKFINEVGYVHRIYPNSPWKTYKRYYNKVNNNVY